MTNPLRYPIPRRSRRPPSGLASLAVAVGLAAAAAAEVDAQASIPIGVGSRVRITAPARGLQQEVGWVMGATDDSLVVQLYSPRR